jgi:hypothetical protein
MIDHNSKESIHSWYNKLIKGAKIKGEELIRINRVFHRCMNLDLWRGNICDAFIKEIGRDRCHDIFDGRDFYW